MSGKNHIACFIPKSNMPTYLVIFIISHETTSIKTFMVTGQIVFTLNKLDNKTRKELCFIS